MTKLAPRTTDQAAAFLNTQHMGPLKWRAMCLSLQRQARGLPTLFPSALAAQHGTPESERVYKLENLRRGMVAYSDDPHDSNPYGHIYFIAGRDSNGTILTWSNDVKRSGGVDLVPITFYKAHWGDTFQFGATWLNGYDFSEFNAVPKPAPDRVTLGSNYDHAIKDIEAAIKNHSAKKHTALVAVLKKDLAHMKAMSKKYQ